MEKALLENIENEINLCEIFRSIACVGDSLSSGEFESVDEQGTMHWHDMYEYSWGQYLARHTGSKVYNFSKGGMTAKEYVESFADKNGFWDEDKKTQAYIIALGVNDIFNLNMEIGSVSDINKDDYTKNAPTFAGYYAHIIQRLKEIQPRAKFFLVTIPNSDVKKEKEGLHKKHRDILAELCQYFDNTYLVDLFTYAPKHDAEFKKRYYLGGHMAPMGYLYMARLIEKYIDNIIREKPEDFREVPFIGTDLKRF